MYFYIRTDNKFVGETNYSLFWDLKRADERT